MGLTFKKTITKWDEGIPLGNGHLGALIWGKAEALRFSLDRADIWDLTPHPRIFEGDFTYQTMVQLVNLSGHDAQQASGRKTDFKSPFERECGEQSKLWESESGYLRGRDPHGKFYPRKEAVWHCEGRPAAYCVFFFRGEPWVSCGERKYI